MTALTGFLNYVLPQVPGCLNAMALQSIFESYEEFCRRSLVYTLTPSAIDIVAATKDYTITPDAGTVVSDVLKVFVSGKEVVPRTEEWLDANVTDWRTTATGPARGYIVPAANTVRLVPIPSSAIDDGLVVKVALRPLETATTCPDVIFNDWRQAIVDGALARLLMMQKKPWTNPRLGQEKQGAFDSWCTNASMKATQAGTRARLRTRAYYS